MEETLNSPATKVVPDMGGCRNLSIWRGGKSLARTWTQRGIAHEIEYIDDVMKTLADRCRKPQRMLGGPIQARTRVC